MKPPPAAVAEAKRKPNGWVYMIEGNFGRNDAVPLQSIKGAWTANEAGEIVGDFMPNPNYIPSSPNQPL